MALNPVVDIGNYTETIPEYHSVKRIFDAQNFKGFKYFTYGDGEAGTVDYLPAENNTIYFWSLGDVFASDTSPFSYITDAAWGSIASKKGLIHSPSGFIDKSIGVLMPKLLIPSKLLVDNGLEIGSDDSQFGELRGAFNWAVSEIDGEGVAFSGIENLKYLNTQGGEDSKFVNVIYKDDTNGNSRIKLHCAINQDRASTDLAPFAEVPDSLVGHGACMILFTVEPINASANVIDAAPGNYEGWSVKIDFPTGELTLTLSDTGSLLVDINGKTTKANLQASTSKEQPPQYQWLASDKPYCLVIIPVWDGVIISDGIQDADDGSIKSQYCIKNKDAHVADNIYFGDPFNPIQDLGSSESLWPPDGSGDPLTGGSIDAGGTSPTDLYFKVSSSVGGENATAVDFGTDLTAGVDVEFKGCKGSIAYLPLFFCPTVKYDQYYQTSTDTDTFRYWEWVYPIWTDNKSSFNMIEYNIDSTYTNPQIAEDTIVGRINYSGQVSDTTFPERFGGEVFGQYFQNDENQLISLAADDGNYPLNSFWTATDGNIGDTSLLSGWKNYIESLNVSINLDGSSGSISVDKFGCAGQRSVVDQNIGSLQLIAYGGYPLDLTQQWSDISSPSDFDKQSGTDNILFTGLGMGAGTSESDSGATFTIPLEGRYKKLEDIILINAPFFDGYNIIDVLQYLCKYGGVSFDPSTQFHGNPTVLTTPSLSSTLISSPLINFQTGTSVRDALTQFCELEALNYYIKRDGKIHFYELGQDGLPTTPGYDWGDFYGAIGYTFKMNSRDNTPDFADLRNKILGVAQKSVNASGNDIKDVPLFPTLALIDNVTVPAFPWQRYGMYPLNGVLEPSQVVSYLTTKAKLLASRYLLSGNISLPVGNPYIEPYDQWTIENDTYIVEGVSHSMDFNSKTWTTSVILFGAH